MICRTWDLFQSLTKTRCATPRGNGVTGERWEVPPIPWGYGQKLRRSALQNAFLCTNDDPIPESKGFLYLDIQGWCKSPLPIDKWVAKDRGSPWLRIWMMLFSHGIWGLWGKVVPLTMARLFVLCGEHALGCSNGRCQEGSSAALLGNKVAVNVSGSQLPVGNPAFHAHEHLTIHAQPKDDSREGNASFQPCHKVQELTKHQFYIVATSGFKS